MKANPTRDLEPDVSLASSLAVLVLAVLVVTASIGTASIGTALAASGVDTSVPWVPAPFTNPVFPGDAADPTVLRVGEHFYVVATESMYYGKHYRMGVLRSPNLVHWDVVGEVFPDRLPAWVDPLAPSLWAPDLVYHDGRYYLYFSAREGPNRHGIGVAWSESPEGPWSFSDRPLVVGDSFRNIDPMIFRDDDGTRYMYWGSAHGPILVQELAPDGLSLVGEARPVLHVAQGLPYQGLIEAPWVIKRDEHYYLFYSGNSPGEYAISVARSTSPLGPFHRYRNNPIIEENEYFRAPGHNAIVQDDAGQDWILYHAYDRNRYGVGRHLMLDKIVWKDGWPTVNGGRGPSWTEQTDGPLLTMERHQFSTGQRVALEPPLFDLARGKVVDASSTRGPGFEASHAVDGTSATRWAPAVDDLTPWIVVDLGGEYRVRRTEIRFRSTHFTRTTRDPALTHDPFRIEQHYRYRIEYSDDGEVWHTFAERTHPGQIAYPYIDTNDVVARFLRVTIVDLRSTQRDPGIFDLRVFGHRDFWVEAPGWETPVSDASPVVVRSLSDDVKLVTVELDGFEASSTHGFPDGPIVNPAVLTDGRHDVVVRVERRDGAAQTAGATFWVHNTQIVSPLDGDTIRRDVPINVEVRVDPDLIKRVRYALRQVTEGVHGVEGVGVIARGTQEGMAGTELESDDPSVGSTLTVYDGAKVPANFELNTLRLPDGEYELIVTVERIDGALSTDIRRVRIHNWNILVDELSPPLTLGWFGTREALKVVDRSDGWRYTSDDPEAFFGDVDRLVADRHIGGGVGDRAEVGQFTAPASRREHLTWCLPSLRSFSVSVYARDFAALKSVVTSVSVDGEAWRELFFSVEDHGTSSTGWHHIELRGEIPTLPSGSGFQYFRVSVEAGEYPPEQLQLGAVVLRGERETEF